MAFVGHHAKVVSQRCREGIEMRLVSHYAEGTFAAGFVNGLYAVMSKNGNGSLASLTIAIAYPRGGRLNPRCGKRIGSRRNTTKKRDIALRLGRPHRIKGL